MQQKRHIQILKASLPYMHSPLREACRICVRIRSQAYLSQSANTARLRSLKRLTW